VALVPNARYRNLETGLRAGDTLLFATDGLGVALSQTGEAYGDVRLFAFLRDFGVISQHHGCANLLRAMHDDVLRYTAPMRPQDDIALLAVRWAGPSNQARSSVTSLWVNLAQEMTANRSLMPEQRKLYHEISPHRCAAKMKEWSL
jgi:hypothetical protein